MIVMNDEKKLTGDLIPLLKSPEVADCIKNTVKEAVDEGMDKFLKESRQQQQNTVFNTRFQNTESLLYGFNALKTHLENEEEYMVIAFKNTSRSVVRFQKTSSGGRSDAEILDSRHKSYLRSKNEFERVKRALEAVSEKKGFKIIELRYLSKTEVKPTWKEIADMLRGTDGFSPKLSEKTVRTYKNNLIREISIILFGTDAI